MTPDHQNHTPAPALWDYYMGRDLKGKLPLKAAWNRAYERRLNATPRTIMRIARWRLYRKTGIDFNANRKPRVLQIQWGRRPMFVLRAGRCVYMGRTLDQLTSRIAFGPPPPVSKHRKINAIIAERNQNDPQ